MKSTWLSGISHHSEQFGVLCLWIVGFVQTVLLYLPDFSYVEVGKAVSLNSLDSVDDNLDWSFPEILGGLDSEMEEWNLENLGLDSEGLGCLAG